MAPYFTEILINCQDGGGKISEIVRTDLPLAELIARGKPYAHSTINTETGDVEHYDPAKDTHPNGPMFARFENIVGETSGEKRTQLFEKIRERDAQHTTEAQVFLSLRVMRPRCC